MSTIHIHTVVYKGWKNAIEISNSDIQIILLPEVGRIIYYGFKGERNILYENKELEGLVFNKGKYFKKEGENAAPNIGGDRVLPCSEEYFNILTGSRHVPDPFINASAYKVDYLENGVVFKSPISQLLGVQIQRTITIEEKGTRVTIQQELIKKKMTKKAALEEIPLTIWSLSKVRTPNKSYLPIDRESIFEKGYLIPDWPDAKNNASINTTVDNAILTLKSSEDLPQKVGADARRWVASFLDNYLFVTSFDFDSQNKNRYPDNGTSVTIFGNELFTELECLSPEKILKVGESIQYNLQWDLCKVSDEKEVFTLLKQL